MDFHTFSFPVADSIEKRLNTSTFSARSFVTSSRCFIVGAVSVAVAQLFQGEERQKFQSAPVPLFFLFQDVSHPFRFAGRH